MRYFKSQKIAVLLVAITTGVFTQASFGAPDARGAAPNNSSTSSGSATGGVNNPSVNNNNNNNPPTPPQSSSPSTSSSTTNQGRATTSDGQSGTAVAPGGQVTTTPAPPAPGTTGSVTSDTTVNGTTNYNQNQKYPTYRGTGQGPSIHSYADHPHEPPHIIGRVSGVNGTQYFISDDGYMYSRERDGRYKRFGRVERHGPHDSLYGMTVTPETVIPGTTDTGTGAVAPTAPAAPVQPPDNSSVAPETVTPAQQEARQRFLDEERRRDAEYQQRVDQQNERERQQSEQDDRTRFRITGRIVADDGQVYYMGSNGYVYYRGGDGHLHMVGGGVPE